MTPKLINMGGLNVAHKVGDGKTSAVVLIHGFGANAYDLYPLHEYIRVPKNTDWYFPDGILEVPFSPTYSGRAWFPISVSDKVQKAVVTGDWSSVADFSPPGLDEARAKINSFIDSLPFSYDKIILGGFSQGAMLALDVFFHREDRPASLVLLSGTLLKENEWKEKAKQKQGFQFFQSHGTNDPILPFGAAKRLEDLLRSAGMVGEFVSFSGGHEIPDSVVKRVNQYLSR